MFSLPFFLDTEYQKGEIIKKVPEEELLKALEYELKNWSE